MLGGQSQSRQMLGNSGDMDFGLSNLNFLDEDIEEDEDRSGSDEEYKRGPPPPPPTPPQAPPPPEPAATPDVCCCAEDGTPCDGEPEELCAKCPRLFCLKHWEEIDIHYCEACKEEFCRPCGKDHPMTCEVCSFSVFFSLFVMFMLCLCCRLSTPTTWATAQRARFVLFFLCV